MESNKNRIRKNRIRRNRIKRNRIKRNRIKKIGIKNIRVRKSGIKNDKTNMGRTKSSIEENGRSNLGRTKNGLKNIRINKIQVVLFAIILLSTAGIWYAERKIEDYRKEPESFLGAEQINCNYKNAWILSWKEGELIFLAERELHSIQAAAEQEYKDVIADIRIEQDKLVSIKIKPDTIRGKVLSVGSDMIEIEGYGKVPVSEHFHVYRNYGEIGEGGANEIIVGYDVQSFFVGGGLICAALLEQRPSVTNIRVLLSGSNAELFHPQVILRAEDTILVEDIEGKECYRVAPQTEIWFYCEEQSKEQRIWLIEESNGAVMEKKIEEGHTYQILNEKGNKIQVISIEKLQGTPSYRSKLEVELRQEGYLLRNELSVEEYLYAVVPSEMPASYGLEALKAQAVCARSYACKNILQNSLFAYGAHVDDSTAFQVYNNIAEQEMSSRAVDETKGQVMVSGEEIVEAYYFSTSCGTTTDAAIWNSKEECSYIQGRFVESNEGQNIALFQNPEELKKEEKFRAFITNRQENDFDSGFPWYRWSIWFSKEDIIRLLQEKGYYDAVGIPTSIQVSRRGSGGVAEELQVSGTEGTIVFEREYAIRAFFSPKGMRLLDKDGKENTSFSLLPSGYFVVDKLEDGEEMYFRFTGGGFGHGAGMSQNAAKRMAEVGYSYSDILKFFYSGVELKVF